jgi:hypothetical protein
MSHHSCRRASLFIRACLWVTAILLSHVSAAGATDTKLTQIIDDHWQWTLEQYPERRLEYGDRSGK